MAAAIERRRRRAGVLLLRGMGEPLACVAGLLSNLSHRRGYGGGGEMPWPRSATAPSMGEALVLEAIGLDDEHTAVYRLLLSTPSADVRRDRPRRLDAGAPRAGDRRRARAARPARPSGLRARPRGRVAAVARAAADAARARASADRGARGARASSASSTARVPCSASVARRGRRGARPRCGAAAARPAAGRGGAARRRVRASRDRPASTAARTPRRIAPSPAACGIAWSSRRRCSSARGSSTRRAR